MKTLLFLVFSTTFFSTREPSEAGVHAYVTTEKSELIKLCIAILRANQEQHEECFWNGYRVLHVFLSKFWFQCQGLLISKFWLKNGQKTVWQAPSNLSLCTVKHVLAQEV